MKVYKGNKKTVYEPNVNIVGAPKTNNGVMSGFSAINYAKLPYTFAPTSSDSWEFVIEITTSSDITTDQGIFMPVGSGNNSINLWCNDYLVVHIFDSSDAYIEMIMLNGSLATNTTYKIKLTYSPSVGYKAYYKTKSNTDFVLGASNTKKKPIKTGVTFQFGTARAVDRPFLGTINFNETYINVNGQRVWSGMVSKVVDTYNLPVIGNKHYGII